MNELLELQNNIEHIINLLRKKELKVESKFNNVPPSFLRLLIQEKTKWHRKRINNLQTKYQVSL